MKLFSRLLSFCQLLRWELLVGVECIFHIIGIAHDKSSWLLDDVLQSFMKAHGPLKISTIGNWSVLLQCQMTFCAAIVPNTKRISVKLSKANTIQLFFFVCVLYIKRTRFSGEIELRYSSAKPWWNHCHMLLLSNLWLQGSEIVTRSSTVRSRLSKKKRKEKYSFQFN